LIVTGVIAFLLYFASVGFGFLLLNKPKKQWTVRTYTIILYFWALVFAVAAIKAPSNAHNVVQTID